MVFSGGGQPLAYERIGRANLGVIETIEIDPEQVRRFLGPLDDVVSAILRGPAHALFAIKTGVDLIGFYVLHPDRRDSTCWWLGWFALDCRAQGFGFGRAALLHILASTRRIAGCRRVRLLVAPDNASALRLYARAAFRHVGTHGSGELILEIELPEMVAPATALLVTAPGHKSNEGRLRSSAGPYAARMIGVERGPPRPGRQNALLAVFARRGLAAGKPERCRSSKHRYKAPLRAYA